MKAFLEGSLLVYYCPGCKYEHSVPVNTTQHVKGSWLWNGDVDKPTLTPSVRHYYTKPKGGEVTTCHYHLREGVLDYCGDSQHVLKGQKIALPNITPFNERGLQ